MLSHFHMGFTMGQNDLVRTSDICGLIVFQLLFKMYADQCKMRWRSESASVFAKLWLFESEPPAHGMLLQDVRTVFMVLFS